MAAVANRRAAITLYSHPECLHSHRVRLVLAEKGVEAPEVVSVRRGSTSEDLLDLNPYNTVPTLVDREVVLYDPRIIIEYLDERFPHPPLLPADPAGRARYRLALYRLERDLYDRAEELQSATPGRARKVRGRLGEILTSLAADFAGRPYMGDEFSLVDCTLAPVLWRLRYYRIELPTAAGRKLTDYGQRLFQRPAFHHSLTAAEAEMAN